MDIKLVSVHVPKTAGTTFGRILERVYGAGAIFRDSGEAQLSQLGPPPFRSHHRAIHGHFWALKYKEILPRTRHIVWLRHPVEWLLSLYSFLDSLGPNSNPAWKFLKEERPGILEFAAHKSVHAQSQAAFMNHAKLDDFFFVGLQESFADDLRDLCSMMGWPWIKPTRSNSNNMPEYRQLHHDVWSDRRTVNALSDLLAADMVLYEAAQRRRSRRSGEILVSVTRSKPY